MYLWVTHILSCLFMVLFRFYNSHTFCVPLFLKISAGLITDKNWTAILKFPSVFSQALHRLSCIRNENSELYPFKSTISPYLKSMTGTNSFRSDSSVHPSFVYRNVWIISYLHPDLVAECCCGTSCCNTKPSCSYSVLLISLKSHYKLLSFLCF